MLLKINHIINKKYVYKNLDNNNFFFIFNFDNPQTILSIYKYFNGRVLHHKQFIKIKKLNLFSGNTIFCFVDSSNFFNFFLDLYFFKIQELKLDVIGICYNNYFLNFNMNYLNIFNCIYSNLVVVYFLIFLFLNLFLVKFFMILKQGLLKKKC